MYPENSQNQQSYPADYLNQIAPQHSKNNGLLGDKRLFIGLIGALLIAFILFVASSMSGSVDTTKQLAARLLSTKDTVTKATENIKSTKMRALNSNLGIDLSNTIREIGPILKNDGVDIEKLDKKITSLESNTKLLETLEDARLNAVYDRTYAREMAYQLSTILYLEKQIYSKTSNDELKTFLENAYKNLEPIQKQFAGFNSTTN